jgi:hypothetical protein
LDLAGRKQIGAECLDDSECRTGYCVGGTCAKRCLTESNCQSGHQCIRGKCRDCEEAYCGHAGEDECESTCPGRQYCEHDECTLPNCWRSSDCPNSDCRFFHGLGRGIASPIPLRGKCMPESEQLCEGREFRVGPNDPFCRLPQKCGEYRENCPRGYFCPPSTDFRSYFKTCARRVAPWPWPPGE